MRVIFYSDTTETVISLMKKLKPRLKDLELLYEVYNAGIMAYKNETLACRCASGLLGALYDALLESDTRGYEQAQVIGTFHLKMRVETEENKKQLIPLSKENTALSAIHNIYVYCTLIQFTIGLVLVIQNNRISVLEVKGFCFDSFMLGL